jgi:hypothetical protein
MAAIVGVDDERPAKAAAVREAAEKELQRRKDNWYLPGGELTLARLGPSSSTWLQLPRITSS